MPRACPRWSRGRVVPGRVAVDTCASGDAGQSFGARLVQSVTDSAAIGSRSGWARRAGWVCPNCSRQCCASDGGEADREAAAATSCDRSGHSGTGKIGQKRSLAVDAGSDRRKHSEVSSRQCGYRFAAAELKSDSRHSGIRSSRTRCPNCARTAQAQTDNEVGAGRANPVRPVPRTKEGIMKRTIPSGLGTSDGTSSPCRKCSAGRFENLEHRRVCQRDN